VSRSYREPGNWVAVTARTCACGVKSHLRYHEPINFEASPLRTCVMNVLKKKGKAQGDSSPRRRRATIVRSMRRIGRERG
jgi:hypothetical protein